MRQVVCCRNSNESGRINEKSNCISIGPFGRHFDTAGIRRQSGIHRRAADQDQDRRKKSQPTRPHRHVDTNTPRRPVAISRDHPYDLLGQRPDPNSGHQPPAYRPIEIASSFLKRLCPVFRAKPFLFFVRTNSNCSGTAAVNVTVSVS